MRACLLGSSLGSNPEPRFLLLLQELKPAMKWVKVTSGIQTGRHKQRSGQHTIARQKIKNNEKRKKNTQVKLDDTRKGGNKRDMLEIR